MYILETQTFLSHMPFLKQFSNIKKKYFFM